MDSSSGIFKFFKSNLRLYRIHLVAWVAFIFWEAVIIGLIYGQFGNLSNYVIHYALNISIFYIHAKVLQRGLKKPNQAFWKLPLYLVVETMFFVGFIYSLDTILLKYTHVFSREMGEPLTRALTVLWRCLFFMFFGTGYYFLISYIETKAEKDRIERQRFKILLEKEKTEKELVQARNAFLKAQINPHLLFNTLEFVYQKFKNHAPKDAEAMLYLADIMRYAASSNDNGEFINLSDEITQCENLIHLHQLTNPESYLSFAYAPDVAEISFIPLVLITVLENMIKHGNLSNAGHPATLDIFMDNNNLIILSRNKIQPIPFRSGLSSGLNNLKNRLAFAYGNHSTVNHLIDEDNYFELTIMVNIKAINQHKSHILSASFIKN